MNTIYNENDPYPAQWLRNLIEAGHISKGTVDDRSIQELEPQDFQNITRVHFFAGIGVWDYALKLAGWPEDREVWTGSCPCQPFSIAGAKRGLEDERHLFPTWLTLIKHRRPATIFGEQVASPAGRAWLGVVQTELEALGYSFGAADLCAASIGAPHIRQRLFFVGHTSGKRAGWNSRTSTRTQTSSSGERITNRNFSNSPQPSSSVSKLAHAYVQGSQGRLIRRDSTSEQSIRSNSLDGNFWNRCEWIPCEIKNNVRKYRPIEPCTFPLAHGTPNRVGRVRAYGNAIVPQIAAQWIRVSM